MSVSRPIKQASKPPKRIPRSLLQLLALLHRLGFFVVLSGFLILFLYLVSLPFYDSLASIISAEPHYTVLDTRLRQLLAQQEIDPLVRPVAHHAPVVLGTQLFFDKELSPNRNAACADCHQLAIYSGDGQILSEGNERHTLALFMRDSQQMQVFGWDGMIGSGDISADPFSQAILHTLSATEEATEITNRIIAIPAYQTLLAGAYPNETISIAHIADALASFVATAFWTDDSAWDRYVAGDSEVLSAEAKRGAILFYGKAGCSQCHSGALLSDQTFYNIGVPHIGAELDFGRYQVTGDPRDYFAFRTPPLRNVALTAPYMHNGAYRSLEDAVAHHFSAEKPYDSSQLPPDLSNQYHDDAYTTRLIMRSLDPLIRDSQPLTEREFAQLMAFLHTLTAPSAIDMTPLIPADVPSGLPVDR